MFFKKQSAGADWLVAGLGNPGKQYEGTRHNAGFDALDHIARRWNAPTPGSSSRGCAPRFPWTGGRSSCSSPRPL